MKSQPYVFFSQDPDLNLRDPAFVMKPFSKGEAERVAATKSSLKLLIVLICFYNVL